MRLTSVFLLGCLVSACAESAPDDLDAPSPPGKSDTPGYSVTGDRAWYLVGNDLTAGDDELALSIDAPSSVSSVRLYLDGRFVRRVQRTAGKFTFAEDIAALPPGAHRVLLAADQSTTAFSALDFTRSHPLYVAVSNDWDDPDHPDDKLRRQERLHERHPDLIITHFVGPYTFTETVTPARRKLLVDWVTNLVTTQGDEIGLHVHPWCTFVRASGVTCRTSPSFAYATGDPTGYTVRLDSYTQPELEKMFAKATELFVANGLPRPTSFRAGGWTAEVHVLAALATAGHVADSSGCNWSRLEEWKNHAGASLYAWNQEHWAPIDETSQPYYPNTTDMLADTAPHLPILEVPDNGLLVDYVTGREMIDMFRANWNGGALTEPTSYSIGYHPVSFSETFFSRLDEALTEIDRHLAAKGAGPVVYVRVSDLPRAYPRPQ